jgi:hypothetical protein
MCTSYSIKLSFDTNNNQNVIWFQKHPPFWSLIKLFFITNTLLSNPIVWIKFQNRSAKLLDLNYYLIAACTIILLQTARHTWLYSNMGLHCTQYSYNVWSIIIISRLIFTLYSQTLSIFVLITAGSLNPPIVLYICINVRMSLWTKYNNKNRFNFNDHTRATLYYFISSLL